MEWVETTGRTVEDAKEAALDQLGIDASEAEFEIIEEPKTGLFGRSAERCAVARPCGAEGAPTKQERRPRRARSGKTKAGRHRRVAPRRLLRMGPAASTRTIAQCPQSDGLVNSPQEGPGHGNRG